MLSDFPRLFNKQESGDLMTPNPVFFALCHRDKDDHTTLSLLKYN